MKDKKERKTKAFLTTEDTEERRKGRKDEKITRRKAKRAKTRKGIVCAAKPRKNDFSAFSFFLRAFVSIF
jgi:hypothetical protein